MLNGIFESVFQVSARASIVIIAIFLLKKLFGNKLNNKLHVVIWAVVLVKLAIPWAPQSRLSLFNAVKLAERAVRQVFQQERDYRADLRKRSESLGFETYSNATGEREEESENLLTAGSKKFQAEETYFDEAGFYVKKSADASGNGAESRTVSVSNERGRGTVPVAAASEAADTPGNEADRRTIPVADVVDDPVYAARTAPAVLGGRNLTGPSHMEDTGKENVIRCIGWVWVAGCVAFMLIFQAMSLLLHIRIKRGVWLDGERIRRLVADCRYIAGVHKEIRIKEAHGITSPLLYGIRNQIIVLPPGMAGAITESELRHVILHELMHCKKRDNLAWAVAFLLRAIHWFNPLVHMAAAEYRNSNEKYCDSMVLERLGEEESSGYGKTLVRLAWGYRKGIMGMASAINGGAGTLKDRIKNIAGFRKGACRWSITAVLILALAACSGISNEVDELEDFSHLEPVDIHIYTRGYGTTSVPQGADEIENMLLEVGKTLSNSIKVTPVFHWIPYEKYEDEVETLVKSGGQVDVITSFGGYGFEGRDVFMDLSSLFPQYAPNYYNELMSHSVGIKKLEYCTQDNKLICVPGNGITTDRAFIVARKDILEKFAPDGFDTLEEYGEFMAWVKEKYPSMVPGYVGAHTFFNTYITGNGYFVYQASNLYKSLDPQRWEEYYSMERLDEFSTAFYMLKDWHDKKYVDARTVNNPEMWLAMGGMASALIDGRGISGYMTNNSPEYEFVIFPLYMETPHKVDVNTAGVSVSVSCDYPERVMMFIEWLHSSQEAYDLFVYGVENRNYVLKGDRIAYYSDKHDIKPLNNWHVTYLNDFRYERMLEYFPDGFKDIYKKACLENVFTSGEVEEKVLGITAEKLESFYNNMEAVKELNDMYTRVGGNINKYFDALESEMQYMNRGFFWHEPVEIIENLKETGIDEYIEFTNYVIKKIRGE